MVFSYISPDPLSVDQETAYIIKEIRTKEDTAGINLEEASIEIPGSIGIVELFHAPLRAAYTKLREQLERSKYNDENFLKMAVFGTEGLCPMRVVFGALPRPIIITPSPSQLELQLAIKCAKLIIFQEQAKIRI